MLIFVFFIFEILHCATGYSLGMVQFRNTHLKIATSMVRKSFKMPGVAIDTIENGEQREKYSTMIISPGYGGGYWYEYHTDFAKSLYTQRCQEQNRSEDQGNRYDPIMIGIIQEFKDGVYINDDIDFVYHDSKYKGFVDVSEYDGAESARINVKAYKLHKIEQIHDSDSLSPEDKVARIGMVLPDKCDDAYIYRSHPDDDTRWG